MNLEFFCHAVSADPSTNLVMKAIRKCSNPRNFSEKLMFLVNRGGINCTHYHKHSRTYLQEHYTRVLTWPSSVLSPFTLPTLHIVIHLCPPLTEDPVAISTPCCPDSMTKFLLDLFSHTDTSGLFYTTDLMVLIDIVSRQLADFGPEDEVRFIP